VRWGKQDGQGISILIMVILSLCIPILSTQASADIINDGGPGGGPEAVGTGNFDGSSPLGQSFSAESTNYKWLGMAVMDYPTSFVNPPFLQYNMTLYEGSGFSGSVLQSSLTLSPSNFGTHYVYFDFSSVPLTIGDTYTTSLTLLSSHGNGTIGPLSGLNNILDGVPYITDQHGVTRAGRDSDGDFLFRAITTTEIPPYRFNVVPKPSSFLLLAAGLLGLAAWRWKRAAEL
jgi:hypothetical protein